MGREKSMVVVRESERRRTNENIVEEEKGKGGRQPRQSTVVARTAFRKAQTSSRETLTVYCCAEKHVGGRRKEGERREE